MKIFVKARPGSRERKTEKIDDEHYIVSVKERAEGNEANVAIFESLAEYFKVPFGSLRLLSGRTSRNKIFDIAK